MRDIEGNQIIIDFEALRHAPQSPLDRGDFDRPSPLAGEACPRMVESGGGGEGELTNDEKQILSLLQRGRENALSVKYLSEATGLKDVEVRQEIRHLIMDHSVLIASSVNPPAGFYIAGTPEEIETATKSLRHRGIMILIRAAKLQKVSLEEIFGQARMEFKYGFENMAYGEEKKDEADGRKL